MFAAMRPLAPALLAVGILCGVLGCTSGPPRTDAQIQADKNTADRVYAALNADQSLYARHITVRARDGVVRLSGIVWDNNDLYEAQRIAANVEGVTQVLNNLELNRNGIDNAPVSR